MNKMIIENIIYATTNIFRIYCFYRFAQFWFKKKNFSQGAEYCLYLLYFIINTVCHIAFHNPLINMITNIIPFFLITYLYQSKNYIRIITTLMIYAVCLLTDAVVYSTAQLMKIDSVVITSGIASTIMLLCTELMIERFIQYRKHQKIIFKHILTILVVPLGSIVIGIFTMQPEQFDSEPEVIMTECFILLVMNAMVFVFYDMTGKVYQQQKLRTILENQNKAYANQIKLINQSQSRIKYLKHDLKNHLLKIRTLAQNGECDKILEYTDEAQKYIMIPEKYVESGNNGIDSILNLKLYEADISGVSVKTEISVPTELDISDFDINIILGNLLDNSLNALSECEEKKLYVKIKYDSGAMYIIIKNTFSNASSQKRKKSHDNDEHGLGLLSVENTIKKYSGFSEFSGKDSVYTAKIVLYL